ncbi:spermidine/putrescine ABC transporter substrate-binding protein [Fibrobacter sp. UBA4297]|uniref:polyamine ABC transporter substrate-binding protein n=1 Tax=Fibrobacter sp. UBA4297 TaxID=1946536 RepID=UPI0025BEAB77|nr:spermidine/putrescine ABC transporter substrate-binding protein [Fibrobacter sp. UBA4297]
MKKIIFIIALFVAIAITVCIQKQGDAKSTKNLTVMIYSEYIDPVLLEDFRNKTGYKVELELYEAQEEMIAKLITADSGKYDVIIASDVVIPQMVHLGLIAPIDTNKIPNHVNVAPQFLGQAYDPTNTYSLPYLWGTTGILFHGNKMHPDSVSYSLLFDAKNTQGKFSLLNESRSMLSMALQANGYDANSSKPEELNKAVDCILQAKKDPHFAGFDGSDIGKDKIISDELWAAIVFSGEAMDAIDKDSSLQYVIPTEGSFMWVDAMTLSSKAKNIEGAYAFMNYILDAKIGAKLAKSINYATPNKASLEIIDNDFKNNRVINPNKQEINRMVFLTDLGDAEKYFDEAWMIIKTH